MIKVSSKLYRLAREYFAAREAQIRDHTDRALNDARAEAHGALLLQMDIEGIGYTDREDAVEKARTFGVHFGQSRRSFVGVNP